MWGMCRNFGRNIAWPLTSMRCTINGAAIVLAIGTSIRSRAHDWLVFGAFLAPSFDVAAIGICGVAIRIALAEKVAIPSGVS
jgi:hypothetical protein